MDALKTEMVKFEFELEPLSAPQPTFQHGGFTFTGNCPLLHKITGEGEQVVSRRGELNRDLVKRTCTWNSDSKVRCRVRLGFSLETTLVRSLWKHNIIILLDKPRVKQIRLQFVKLAT